jgi:hypothetical protein
MSFSNNQNLLAQANHFWSGLNIDSVDKLKQWQTDCYLSESEIRAMDTKLRAGTLDTLSETRLAKLYLSTSTQLFYNLATEAKNAFKSAHEQGSQKLTGFEIAPALFYLPDALQKAFNPTGSSDFSEEERKATQLTLKELVTKIKSFKLAHYESYPDFALEVISHHLPSEYVKLLRLEYSKQKTMPENTVDAGVINPDVQSVIRNIANGKDTGGR